MTVREWYQQAVERLDAAGCEAPGFEAACLLEDIAARPRGAAHAWEEAPLPETACTALRQALQEREAGRPLQYILGEWEFLDLRLRVGEGVLIPRPDTELLCEVAAARLPAVGSPRVLDLCSGSGCVALGVARLFPPADVTAVELSEEAWPYLQENIRRYPACRVTAVQADVLRDAARFDGPFGAILSNPPYIPTAELPGLMREVQREPRMALDGGDGLQFYRAIAADWLQKLCSGGFAAVEVGMGQAADVAAIFERAGLEKIEVFRDLSDIERVVLGYRNG